MRSGCRSSRAGAGDARISGDSGSAEGSDLMTPASPVGPRKGPRVSGWRRPECPPVSRPARRVSGGPRSGSYRVSVARAREPAPPACAAHDRRLSSRSRRPRSPSRQAAGQPLDGQVSCDPYYSQSISALLNPRKNREHSRTNFVVLPREGVPEFGTRVSGRKRQPIAAKGERSKAHRGMELDLECSQEGRRGSSGRRGRLELPLFIFPLPTRMSLRLRGVPRGGASRST